MNAHDHANYDYIIVGGGISGLYCAKALYEKYRDTKSILVLDDRKYFGGRLITHYHPQYEIGGARFHENHTLLMSLIKEYNIDISKISSKVVYIHKTRQDKTIYYNDANKTFDLIMSNIIQKAKSIPKKDMIQYTTKELIDKLCQSTELSRKIINIFGYSSEFCTMNAYDALNQFQSEFVEKQYYVLNDGFSNFINIMVKDLKRKGVVMKGESNVHDVKREHGHYCVCVSKTNTNSNLTLEYTTHKVIFATKAHQLKSFKILKPIHRTLSCISGQPLLRIYAKFPKLKRYGNMPWFHEFPRITTNSFLRHIIPINPENGLIMISYTDGNDIKPFMKNKWTLKSDEEIKDLIIKELKVLFPDLLISSPPYFKCHLWTIGAHYWRKNCDSTKILSFVRNPLENIYVVGEAFSHKQAWIEGSLESVESIFPSL
jgi:glycine/D-amino acid oxidase-like deaminating enzyme